MNIEFNRSLLLEQTEIISGEEDEQVVYSQRAQLLHFYNSAWHRRGIGQLKILKHNETGKLRIVMRHEDTNEPVCLNHILNDDVTYKVKDAKAWCFAVNDYSEGEYEFRQLCLRFKTSDIALGFKAAVDDALSCSSADELVASERGTSEQTARNEQNKIESEDEEGEKEKDGNSSEIRK